MLTRKEIVAKYIVLPFEINQSQNGTVISHSPTIAIA